MTTKAPTSYIESEIEIQKMMQGFARNLETYESGLRQIKTARDEFERMNLPAPQGFNSLATFLRDQAAANPGDPVWTSLAARMDRTVSEFETVVARVIETATRLQPPTE